MMTISKGELFFIGACLAGIAALVFLAHQQPGTGSVLHDPVNSTGTGDGSTGPAYLMSNAPYLYQPWNGGAVIPQATSGMVGQTDGMTDMSYNSGGCACGG